MHILKIHFFVDLSDTKVVPSMQTLGPFQHCVDLATRVQKYRTWALLLVLAVFVPPNVGGGANSCTGCALLGSSGNTHLFKSLS